MESVLEEIAKGARSCEEIQETLNDFKQAFEANPRTRTVGDYLSGVAGDIKALKETFVGMRESWETINGTQRTQISSLGKQVVDLTVAEAKQSELLLAQSTQISNLQEQVANLPVVDAKHSELLLAHAQLRTKSDSKDNNLSEKQKDVDKLKVVQQELASKIKQQTTDYDNVQQQLQSSISKSTQLEGTVADLSRRLQESNEKAERAERLAKEVETTRKQDELDRGSVQATYGVDTSSIKPWNQTLLAALYKNEAEHKEKIETEVANMPQLMAAIHQEELDRRLSALTTEYKRKEAEVKERYSSAVNVAEDNDQSLEQKIRGLEVLVNELNQRHIHTMMGQRTHLERQIEELRSNMQQQIDQLRKEADLALKEHDGTVKNSARC